MIFAATTHAATLTVNTAADENGTGSACSLREAIAAANTDTPVGGCPAGSGADTILFSLSLPATITLTASELGIASDVTITGPGKTQLAIDGNHTTRVFSITLAGQLTMSDLTIQNGQGSSGGGIDNAGTVTLTDCTLRGNSASGDYRDYGGGGIYNTGTLTLTNTIIANSPSGGDCRSGESDAVVTDNGHNLIEDATNSCGLTNGVNGNIVGVDPMLGPLAANGGPTQTHALCTGAGVPDPSCTGKSPAIDAVPTAACVDAQRDSLTTDQRGYVRPQGPACDIGAYESGAQPATVCAGDCNGDHAVTVDEILVLVNIALGSAQPAACPSGIPPGATVDVGLIIQAVNHVLSGCGGS